MGKVTEGRLKLLGISTVGDLQALTPAQFEEQFGLYGSRLYELARGIDENPVVANRPTKSISAEDTRESDVPLPILLRFQTQKRTKQKLFAWREEVKTGV